MLSPHSQTGEGTQKGVLNIDCLSLLGKETAPGMLTIIEIEKALKKRKEKLKGNEDVLWNMAHSNAHG